MAKITVAYDTTAPILNDRDGLPMLDHSGLIINSVNVGRSPLPRVPSWGLNDQHEKYYKNNIISHSDVPMDEFYIRPFTGHQIQGVPDFHITNKCDNIPSIVENKRNPRIKLPISPYQTSPITGITECEHKSNIYIPHFQMDHHNSTLYSHRQMHKVLYNSDTPGHMTRLPIGGKSPTDGDGMHDRPLWLKLLMRRSGDHPLQDAPALSVLSRGSTESSGDQHHRSTLIKNDEEGDAIYRHSYEVNVSPPYTEDSIDRKRRLQVLRSRINSRRALNKFHDGLNINIDTDVVSCVNGDISAQHEKRHTSSCSAHTSGWDNNSLEPNVESIHVSNITTSSNSRCRDGRHVDPSQTCGDVIYHPPRNQSHDCSHYDAEIQRTRINIKPIRSHSHNRTISVTRSSSLRLRSSIKSPLLHPITSPVPPPPIGKSDSSTCDSLNRRHRKMLEEKDIYPIPVGYWGHVRNDANKGSWILEDPVMGLDIPFDKYLLEKDKKTDTAVPNRMHFSGSVTYSHASPFGNTKIDVHDAGGSDYTHYWKAAVQGDQEVRESIMSQEPLVIPLHTTVSLLNTAIARNENVLGELSDADNIPRLHAEVPRPISHLTSEEPLSGANVVDDKLYSELRDKVKNVSTQRGHNAIEEDVAKVMMMMDVL